MSLSSIAGKTSADYPPTAFFAVHKGIKKGVYPTFDQLAANVRGHHNPKWQVFSNKMHANQYVETGEIPQGASPVEPGMHVSPVRRTMSAAPTGAGRAGTSPLKTYASAPAKVPTVSPFLVSAKLVNGAGPKAVSNGTSKPIVNGNSKTTVNGNTSAVASGSKGRASPTPVGKPFKPKPSTASSAGNQRNSSTVAGKTAGGSSSRISVWTDGSCLNNGKPDAKAAYAVYFGPNDKRNEAMRIPGKQTNNRGELMGVIRALEIVDENVEHLTVYTDSKYVIDCITKWLAGWIKNGGFTSSKKPALNYAMIRYLSALMQRRGNRVELLHVAAHRDNVGNNAADALANAAALTNGPTAEERDWDLARVGLEKKKTTVPAKGPAVVAEASLSPCVLGRQADVLSQVGDSVPSSQTEELGSDYDYSDIELADDDLDIDIDDIPLTQPTPPVPAATTRALKREREEVAAVPAFDEEIPDSDTERRAARKAGKRRQVECPSCQHKFPITFQK